MLVFPEIRGSTVFGFVPTAGTPRPIFGISSIKAVDGFPGQRRSTKLQIKVLMELRIGACGVEPCEFSPKFVFQFIPACLRSVLSPLP